MGSTELPAFLEHWISVIGLWVAGCIVLFGAFLVLDSFRDHGR